MGDTDLLAAIKWVEDAVAAVDVGLNPLTSFYLHHGYIHAHNGRMVAATPFRFDTTALVPSATFTKVLTHRPPGDISWAFDPVANKLILKQGRFRGKIKLLPVEEWVYSTETPNALPIPDGLTDAIRKVLPFCSDNATQPWATCLGITGDYLYASNNVAVARVRCLGVGSIPFLLPRWAAKFIVDREDGLLGWEHSDTHIAFTWEDGSWMRSTLIVAAFPNTDPIFAAMGDPQVEITPTWRSCITRVGKIAEDTVIRLRVDGVHGRTAEVLEVEDDAKTPVPEGVIETMWDLRYLAPMAEIATHWDPCAWPKPAGFRGPGIEGVLLGRRD